MSGFATLRSMRRQITPVRIGAAALIGITLTAAATASRAQSTEIGVYSGRHYNTDKQLYSQFTRQTGIKVKLLEAKDDALIERLRSAGGIGRRCWNSLPTRLAMADFSLQVLMNDR